MSQQARVTSVDALDAFRASLVIFVTKAREAVDTARDRVRRTDAQVSAEQLEIAGQEPSQEMVLQGREELAAVEAAACALPPRCREVFFFSRFEGMSNAAVAQRLGISVSMVEQHIVKAMWEIRQNVKRPVARAGEKRLRKGRIL